MFFDRRIHKIKMSRRNSRRQQQARAASDAFASTFAAAVPTGTTDISRFAIESSLNSDTLVVQNQRENVRPQETIEPPPLQENLDADTITNTNNDNDDNDNNVVTIDTIRDSIVSERTNRSYVGDLTAFLKWVVHNENGWLTEHGRTRLAEAEVRREDETLRHHRTRKIIEMKALLRDSFDHPVVQVSEITASRYMDFVLSITGKGNIRYLSKSAYGNKRSALFHLFRLHNRVGYNDSFKVELTNLFRGFYRTITQYRPPPNPDNNNNDEKGKEQGKEPMSIELYKAVLGWLLDYGTSDGVFADCYLVLTWNLACRARNTGNIRFRDISWSSSFDSYAISFAHTKTDQLGEEAKYLRHMYANPHLPLVCPVLALSLYLTSCFNTVQTKDSFVFPGKDQSKRFGKILMNVLKEKKEEVSQLGFSLSDIGTHSVRKGAVTYAASLPGGPSAAAICLRAGWTQGKIKDVYMRYLKSGDQFVGRCLSLLPILRSEFASSPPHFKEHSDWIDTLRDLQFPMISLIAAWGRLSLMCLASTLYNRVWLMTRLTTNHVFLVTSYCFRSSEVLQKVTDQPELVVISYPWNDDCAFSGIPPHVAILQDMTLIKNKQTRLVAEFVGELKGVLEQMGVDGGRMSEYNLQTILKKFEERLDDKIGLVSTQSMVAEDSNRKESERTYVLHYYGGSYHRVPEDWRFPRCGVADLWRHWWIGDSVRNIPPLRLLHHFDVKHIDSLPMGEDEEHGRTGVSKQKRRPARKILSDIKFLMGFITQKVKARGAFELENLTVATVDSMFKAVADCFDNNDRDSQRRWRTVIHDVRSKKIT
jgi:hypothetical protein